MLRVARVPLVIAICAVLVATAAGSITTARSAPGTGATTPTPPGSATPALTTAPATAATTTVTSPAPVGEAAAADRGRLLVDADGESDLRPTDVVSPPAVQAQAWVVYDSAADEFIAGRAVDTPRPIASLTKVMTALVVVEATEGNELVTIPAEAVDIGGTDASLLGVREDERWRVDDLLDASLVYSANDAAQALAVHVGRGDTDAFIATMNMRARELGMTNTTFTSVTGLDGTGAVTRSTPGDLALLARTVLLDPRIRAAVRTPSLRLTRPGTDEAIELENRNPLLRSVRGVDGVKTGFTEQAGYMFMVHAADATGNDLVIVTADSPTAAARRTDAAALLGWATPLRQRIQVVEGGEELGVVPVNGTGRDVTIFACDPLVVSARIGDAIGERTVLAEALEPPVPAGEEVGRVTATIEGEEAGAVPACTASAVAEPSRTDRVKRATRDWRGTWQAGLDGIRRIARAA